tara:strand:- start:2080 stop:2676 length:597 start_codon:yes stop_codon:yes gene_type:complete
MAIVRPKSSSGGGNKYYGICEANIIGYTDKSANFHWADIFIEVEIKQKDSDYTKKMQIAGSLERDSDNKVSGGSVLNRMYKFFDVIGCKAGVNIDGHFELEDGTPILDIAEYLNENFVHESEQCPFLVYVYKSIPKPNETQSYTRVVPKIHLNTQKGMEQMENDIAYMKKQGIIKEIDPNVKPNDQQVNLSNGALDNL